MSPSSSLFMSIEQIQKMDIQLLFIIIIFSYALGILGGVFMSKILVKINRKPLKHSPKLKDENLKMVLVIRQDLNMQKGKVAAQCSHATLSAYQKSLENEQTKYWLDCWEEFGQAKITLKCLDEKQMY